MAVKDSYNSGTHIYLDLGEKGLKAARFEEEINGVILTRDIGVISRAGGPEVGPTYGLFPSPHITPRQT